LSPRQAGASQTDVDRAQSPPKSGVREDEDGYKLRPVAYNPNSNPQAESAEDPRQSWQQGDDSHSMQPKPQKRAPPKPPKVSTNARSAISPSLRTAPQLPPLYFESQPQVKQQDFAYSKPQGSSISKTSSVTRRSLEPDIPRSDSVTILPLPFLSTRPPSAAQTEQRPRQASPSLQPQQKSIRKSPPTPVDATSSSHHSSLPTIDRSEAPNSIATGRSTAEDKPARIPQTIDIPQQGQSTVNGDEGETNNSFYFHSPQSSSDSAHGQSPKSTAVDQSAVPPAKIITTDYGLSSASALGFGGPSDWEHFGDYYAEEIDDTDLYVSTKPKPAELPVVASPAEEPKPESASNTLNSGTVALSEISPKAADKLDPTEVLEQTEHSQSEKSEDQENTDTNSETPTRPTFSNYVLVPPIRDNKVSEPIIGHVEHTEIRKSNEQSYQVFTPSRNGQMEDISSDAQVGHEGSPQDTGAIEEPPAKQDLNDHIVDEVLHPDGTTHVDIDREQEAKHDSTNGAEIFEAVPVINRQGTGNEGAHGTELLQADDPLVTGEHHLTVEGQEEESDLQGDRGEDIIISLHMPHSPPEMVNESRPRGDSPKPMGVSRNVNHLDPMARLPLEGARAERNSMFPKSVELEDPYANLDAWAKASLNRYVKMLREEASAESDEDKYAIFTNFTRRETRLRAVLYDMDEESEPSEPPAKRIPLKGSTSIVTLRPSIRSKALPALPPGVQYPPASPAREPPMRLETTSRQPAPIEGVAPMSTTSDFNTQSKPVYLDGSDTTEQSTSEGSYVMVESPTTESYTPGGRPVLTTIKRDKATTPLKPAQSLTSLRKALDAVGEGMTVDHRSPTPVESAPPAAEKPRSETPRLNSIPIPPIPSGSMDITRAYTPSQYNEGRPYEGDKASNRQSIYGPFSSLLRESSQRQSSLYNGLDNRRKSQARASISSKLHPDILKAGQGVNSPKVANQRFSILEPLLDVIPSNSTLRPEPVHVARIRQQTESIPEDFTFIHDTVLSWHAETKQKQEIHDRERHARQGENEQRIDALFNDNEIGYGDISELEAEFKRSEAARKAEEDRTEYQSFVKNVFQVVWHRLHYEMDQLTPLYETCVQMLNVATAGKEMFEESGDRVPVAPAMDNLLNVYQKLAIRHQKAFEAVLERDRRLKKTEVGPWYALGNIGKVKSIEKRFEEAEKKAILEFCRQRDNRANLLMDVLDQNTLRGVGSNQDYMESLMQAVRKISIDVALSPQESPLLPSSEILRAQTITAALSQSSSQIVQTFHVADMLLNSADYEVSVANARLANADADAFKRLREAKAKEDQKLVKDLEHRMSLIKGDTTRTQDEITKLLNLVGSSPSEEEGKTREPNGSPDLEKQARLQAALEEAKKRNAQRESQIGDVLGG
jgi:hypothetical protein